MKKSDLMGRFAFDGAEGIAFWIGDSDTEPIAKVMFDELETLKAFIEHNLPGMFGEPNESGKVRQERAKLVAVRDILNRDDFGDEWEHDEWVYLQAAEGKLADIEEALGSVMLAVPDAEVAAKAWDEGYWQGINGHTGPGNPYRDKDDIVNRKAVQS